jgi:STE24 endopeptidase
MAVLLLRLLVSIPMKLVKTFGVEEKYGFNKMTKCNFGLDVVKEFALTTVAIWLLLPFILWVIDASGDLLILALIIGTILVVLLVNILFPLVIVPCFNKFEPFPEGELKEKIKTELARTNVKV